MFLSDSRVRAFAPARRPTPFHTPAECRDTWGEQHTPERTQLGFKALCKARVEVQWP